MDRTIELLRQALDSAVEEKVRTVQSDFERAASLAREAIILLSRHVASQSPVSSNDQATFNYEIKFSQAALDALSDFEKKLFSLIGSELTDDQIATQLEVAVKTFYNRRDMIVKKIGVRNSYELAALARGIAAAQNKSAELK